MNACIFDLDGTLLNTIDDIADCVNEALGEHGYAQHPVSAYKYFVGNGTDELIVRALPPEARGGGAASSVLARYTELYARRGRVKTRPYEGVEAMLLELARRRVPCAVLSNKPQEATVSLVEHYFNDIQFVSVLGGRDGIALKPDPVGALEQSRLMGVAPRDILYVGDTGVDMQTARAAGMIPVGVLWGFREAEELRSGGASRLIERPSQLLELLP